MLRIHPKLQYALIGASQAPEKYGNIIFLDFLQAGYAVFPINPREKEIAGIKVFPRLSTVKQPIDVVIFVVPPQITLEVLQEVKALGISQVWMQPGSESAEAIAFCEAEGIAYNPAGSCIMVERRKADIATH